MCLFARRETKKGGNDNPSANNINEDWCDGLMLLLLLLLLKEVSRRWFGSLHQFTHSNLFLFLKRVFRGKKLVTRNKKIGKIRNIIFFYSFTARHHVYLVALSPIGILNYSFSMLVILLQLLGLLPSPPNMSLGNLANQITARENGKKLIRFCFGWGKSFFNMSSSNLCSQKYGFI